MYMPLIATKDSMPMFMEQPGIMLEPGDILSILTLDDPMCVKHAKPFDGLLPLQPGRIPQRVDGGIVPYHE